MWRHQSATRGRAISRFQRAAETMPFEEAPGGPKRDVKLRSLDKSYRFEVARCMDKMFVPPSNKDLDVSAQQRRRRSHHGDWRVNLLLDDSEAASMLQDFDMEIMRSNHVVCYEVTSFSSISLPFVRRGGESKCWAIAAWKALFAVGESYCWALKICAITQISMWHYKAFRRGWRQRHLYFVLHGRQFTCPIIS